MGYTTDLEESNIQIDKFTSARITYYVNGKPRCLRRNWVNDGLCTNYAGKLTNHPFEGACSLHDFYSPKGYNGMKNAKYSGVLREDLQRQYDEFLQDPDFLDLTEELSMQRTLASEALTRYTASNNVDELKLAHNILSGVVASVDKIQKIKTNQIMTIAQARYLMLRAVNSAQGLFSKWFGEDVLQERLEEFITTWQNDVETLMTKTPTIMIEEPK